MRVFAKMDGGTAVTALHPFNLVMTKDCQYATISADSATQTDSYTVNNANTAKTMTFTTFTVSDQYCDVSYKVQLWNDLNADTVQDSNEFTDVTLTSEAVGSGIVYKPLSTNREVKINR